MSSYPTFQPIANPALAEDVLKGVADIDPRLTRTHYFDGRLLTAVDLNRDQLYLDQRLREVGQALGTGVQQGLETSLNPSTGLLTVGPGVGITGAGRILDLRRELSVELGNRALIAELNGGQHRHLGRGLYAVVLSYAEIGTDIAEVFPTDLGAERKFQFDVMSEGVQLALVPLPQPLPQASELAIRARLIREYLGGGQVSGVIPEDAVALGVLAVRDDAPQWLDTTLLRQPLRRLPGPSDLQQDLARHYEALLRDVRAQRLALGEDFAAAEYFHWLPPAGHLPKATIDPVGGRQGYFPENYRVWAAPIRRSDLPLVIEESMALPPIDLASGEPIDIVVLAPLSATDFGHYAKQLEPEFDPETRKLPTLDLLRLRLFAYRPTHALDLDQQAWSGLWPRVDPNELVYVRRPMRAAETAISGIVLAIETAIPEHAEPLATTTPVSETQSLLLDEDAVLLSRIGLDDLAKLRGPTTSEGEAALADLRTEFGKESGVLLGCLRLLLRIERRYDPVIWQTLFALAKSDLLAKFQTDLIDGQVAEVADGVTGKLVSELLVALGLDSALAAGWEALVEA